MHRTPRSPIARAVPVASSERHAATYPESSPVPKNHHAPSPVQSACELANPWIDRLLRRSGRARGPPPRRLPLSLIHISEPTRQAEISYAVFCLKKKKN